MREALTRGFILVWLAGLIMQGGYWMVVTTLQWQVAILPNTSPKDLGTLYFAQLLPMMLFAPLAGALVDRFNPKILVSCAMIGFAGVGLAGAMLHDADLLALAVCLALALILGSLLTLQSPTMQVLVTYMVPPQGLHHAISIYAVAQNIARMLGPVAAGALLILGGTSMPLWWVAALGTLAVITFAFVPRRRPSRPLQKESFVKQIAGGFTVLRREPAIRRAIALVAVNGAGTLSFVSMLSYVATEMAVGEGGFSIMMAASGLGAIVGAVVPYPRVRALRDISTLQFVSVTGLLTLGLSHTLALATFACLVTSAAATSANVRLNVMVQSQVNEAVRGRVMSLFSWAWGGSLPLGGLLLGLVADATSVHTSFLVLAGVLLTLALANFFTAKRINSAP